MNAAEFRKLINRVYFGIEHADTKVDYVQDDINKVFKSLVKYYVVAEILNDTKESVIIGREELYSTNWEHSEALIEIYKSIEIEYLIRLRMLLAKERYVGRKPKDVRRLAECEDGSQTGGSLIEDLKEYCRLDKRRKKLERLVVQFDEKDYYGKIVAKNQKILLHKDKGPEKRAIKRIVKSEYESITYYRSRVVFDRDEIIGAIEGISEIIILYLGNDMNNYRIANIESVYDYVRKLVCALYNNEKSEIIADRLTRSLKICFKNTLKIIHWR